MLRDTLQKLALRQDLTSQECQHALSHIMQGDVEPVQTAAFLMGLRTKGETVDELFGCAQVLLEHEIKVEPQTRPLLDTCGTGGDGLHTINISTISALMIAASGVPIAKHGNRSISSKCGSADLLELMGIPLQSDPQAVATAIDRHRFGFLFAPHFHPAMRHVGAVRKTLGLRTVFNLLGPLANPARAEFQVIGVFSPNWIEPVAHLAQRLGTRKTLVVHSSEGLDELSLGGPNRIAIATPEQVTVSTWDPSVHGLPSVPLEALAGGTPSENLQSAQAILAGEDSGRAQTCWLNAGAGLFAYGAVTSIEEGYARIRNNCLQGTTSRYLKGLLQSRP